MGDRHPSILGVRCGQDRNSDKALSHTYAETAEGLLPMCGYGWNRSNGASLSIFRGSPGTEGECKICRRRLAAGLPPLAEPFPHKTKWV